MLESDLSSLPAGADAETAQPAPPSRPAQAASLPPVLMALRAATATRHATLDSGMPLSVDAPTLADYRDHLRLLAAWLQPMEAWLGHFDDGPQDAARLAPRRRAELIAADLAHPSVPGPVVALPPAAWSGDATPAHRWGVAYVVEGSQLGGVVLQRRLAGALAPHPLAYLAGDVDGVGPRWLGFLRALGEAVQTETEIADACQGAMDAFDKLLAVRDSALTEGSPALAPPPQTRAQALAP